MVPCQHTLHVCFTHRKSAAAHVTRMVTRTCAAQRERFVDDPAVLLFPRHWPQQPHAPESIHLVSTSSIGSTCHSSGIATSSPPASSPILLSAPSSPPPPPPPPQPSPAISPRPYLLLLTLRSKCLLLLHCPKSQRPAAASSASAPHRAAWTAYMPSILSSTSA